MRDIKGRGDFAQSRARFYGAITYINAVFSLWHEEDASPMLSIITHHYHSNLNALILPLHRYPTPIPCGATECDFGATCSASGADKRCVCEINCRSPMYFREVSSP